MATEALMFTMDGVLESADGNADIAPLLILQSQMALRSSIRIV